MDKPLVTNGFCTEKEGIDFESKRCGDRLPLSIWETYSAFANTFGGTIALGFTETDDGRLRLTGVADPEKIVRDLWSVLHDPHKVSINLLTERDVSVQESDSKSYIVIRVPRADRHRRPVYINGDLDGGTYRRNREGDYHCTVAEIFEMARDSSDEIDDQRVLEEVTSDDIDSDTLAHYRRLFDNRNPGHIWKDASDEDFLRFIGAAARKEGRLGITQAGLLMFGHEYSIIRSFPNYLLDYREYDDDENDWSDRIVSFDGTSSGNLLTFFEQVATRIHRNNRHPFALDGFTRVDDTDIMRAQREMVLNALIHADYQGRCGIVIVSTEGEFRTENPGTFRIPISEAVEGGHSDPRNPILMRMFALIGHGERAGSGVNRILDTCVSECLPHPEISEDLYPSRVVFRMFLQRDRKNIDEMVIDLISRDDRISQEEMARRLRVSKSTAVRTVDRLKSSGALRREGGPRGRWIISRTAG